MLNYTVQVKIQTPKPGFSGSVKPGLETLVALLYRFTFENQGK